MPVGFLKIVPNLLDCLFKNEERNGLVMIEGNKLTYFAENNRFIYIQVKLTGDDVKFNAKLYNSKASAVSQFISVKDFTDRAGTKNCNEAGVRLAKKEIIKHDKDKLDTLLIPIEVDTNHPGREHDLNRTYFIQVTIGKHTFTSDQSFSVRTKITCQRRPPSYTRPKSGKFNPIPENKWPECYMEIKKPELEYILDCKRLSTKGTKTILQERYRTYLKDIQGPVHGVSSGVCASAAASIGYSTGASVSAVASIGVGASIAADVGLITGSFAGTNYMTGTIAGSAAGAGAGASASAASGSSEPIFERTLKGDKKRKSHGEQMSDNLEKRQKLSDEHTALVAKKEEIETGMKELLRKYQELQRRQNEVERKSAILLDKMTKNKEEYDCLKLQKDVSR